jgi:hypothetical protein
MFFFANKPLPLPGDGLTSIMSLLLVGGGKEEPGGDADLALFFRVVILYTVSDIYSQVTRCVVSSTFP